MLANGDKIKLVKPMGVFTNVGEICEVVSVDSNAISFKFGNGMHLGIMSVDEFERYFEKYEEPVAPTITLKQIEEIIENSEILVNTIFDKCTIVTCKLPNGFVITESSACVSPENYNEEMGFNICIDKIADKIWELEGYRLQDEVWRAKVGFAPCDECCYGECEGHDCEGGFLGTAVDCEDCNECDVYDCPHNTRS
jgi:hypothetical protein